MRYGFGTGQTDLKTLRAGNPDAQSWKVQEQSQPGGGTVFRIDFSRSTVAKGPQPVGTYILDPKRGFLITSAIVYDPAGAVEAKRQITVRQVAGDVWFPQEVTDEAQGRITKLSAKNVKVNIPVEDSQFTIAALRMPNGNRVARTQVDGKVQQFIYQDGKLVPIGR